ncbi:hypothetical protein Pint_18593 [Pistacia integerrima]|uniref:Uncharacterized protein n=1 Tax=Pistacia integerrima TaxID=434235 RepID=A0ACC0YV97_9ROSI|nr:hypothetical protein Pint_18593 [Pistacia integerrima]
MLSDLFKLAAVKARDAVEGFFKLNNIDMAIRSLTAAKEFNPEVPNTDDYFTAYKVHEVAAKNSTWYEILSLSDIGVDSSMIRKQCKRMALVLHPDKNHSVAAEGAFKLIQSAFQVLIVPEKRQSYDSSLCSKKRPHQSPHTASAKKPNPVSPSPKQQLIIRPELLQLGSEAQTPKKTVVEDAIFETSDLKSFITLMVPKRLLFLVMIKW